MRKYRLPYRRIQETAVRTEDMQYLENRSLVTSDSRRWMDA
jgi:hypothetical protein